MEVLGAIAGIGVFVGAVIAGMMRGLTANRASIANIKLDVEGLSAENKRLKKEISELKDNNTATLMLVVKQGKEIEALQADLQKEQDKADAEKKRADELQTERDNLTLLVQTKDGALEALTQAITRPLNIHVTVQKDTVKVEEKEDADAVEAPVE